VALYIPPNGIARDTHVIITPAAAPPPADPAVDWVGPIFTLSPPDLVLDKPATLSLSSDTTQAEQKPDLSALSLFKLDAAQQWQHIGGTVDARSGQVRATIGQLGTYGLLAASADAGPRPALTGLSCQPRLISPRGGAFATAMDISFALGRAAPTTVRIFDMAGHLIRTLIANEDLAPGSNVTTWDGRDQDGRTVFAGAYVVLVAAGDKNTRQIVAVVNGQQ